MEHGSPITAKEAYIPAITSPGSSHLTIESRLTLGSMIQFALLYQCPPEKPAVQVTAHAWRNTSKAEHLQIYLSLILISPVRRPLGELAGYLRPGDVHGTAVIDISDDDIDPRSCQKSSSAFPRNKRVKVNAQQHHTQDQAVCREIQGHIANRI